MDLWIFHRRADDLVPVFSPLNATNRKPRINAKHPVADTARSCISGPS